MLIMTSCHTTKDFSYTVIQQNFFDSNKYSMNDIDTNSVNKELYRAVFNTFRIDTSIQVLLMKRYSNNVVLEEYGAYDFKTKNYLYCSSKLGKSYSFKKDTSEESKLMYNRMLEFILKPGAYSTYIHGREQLLDENNFKLSLISVNSDYEVIVKSYYW